MFSFLCLCGVRNHWTRKWYATRFALTTLQIAFSHSLAVATESPHHLLSPFLLLFVTGIALQCNLSLDWMCAVCARAVFFSPLYSVFGARSENGTSRLGYGTERAEEMCRCERKQLLQITVRIETKKKRAKAKRSSKSGHTYSSNKFKCDLINTSDHWIPSEYTKCSCSYYHRFWQLISCKHPLETICLCLKLECVPKHIQSVLLVLQPYGTMSLS